MEIDSDPNEDFKVTVESFAKEGAGKKLLERGVEVLCVCEYGKVRSLHLAEQFRELNINSFFLGGGIGINGVMKLSDEEKSIFVENISLIPNVVVVLADFEVRHYQKQIDLLNSKRNIPAIIHYHTPMPNLVKKLVR